MKDTKQYLGHMLLSIPKDITAVSLTVNFPCSIVLMCLIVSSGLRFSNSVNTLNNVLTFLALKGKVIIKNWACPAFDPVVHITEDNKTTTRQSKIFLHENNNKTIVFTTQQENIYPPSMYREHKQCTSITLISDNYQRAACMEGYLDIVTSWVPSGPFLRNTNNLS